MVIKDRGRQDYLIAEPQIRERHQRKVKLAALLATASDDRLRLSLSFDDGDVLLEAAARLSWIKVETATWREANRERYKLFEKLR